MWIQFGDQKQTEVVPEFSKEEIHQAAEEWVLNHPDDLDEFWTLRRGAKTGADVLHHQQLFVPEKFWVSPIYTGSFCAAVMTLIMERRASQK